MKIEVGKYYKTRDGRKAGPIEHWAKHPTFNICGYVDKARLIWAEDGKYGYYGSVLDLVEEWKEEPKLWKDMTDEEKGALLLADHQGKYIEYYTGDRNWASSVFPKWADHVAYRVKPEPVVKQACHAIVYNKQSYKVTYNTIDGEPDCSSVSMSKM